MLKTIHSLALFALGATAYADTDTRVLEDGWRFHMGELDSVDQSLDADAFPGVSVILPHDWAADGPFNPEAHGGTGKLPWQGVGWYRQEFTLDAVDRGKRVYLDFDGAMAFPTVYLNGREVGGWDYGYTPFRIDATDAAAFGETNVLSVKLDTRKWSSRWYPGAGLYRKVSLTLAEPVHLAHWGVGITTDGDERLVLPPENATVSIAIESHRERDADVAIEASLLDPDGRQIARKKTTLTAISGATSNHQLAFHAPDAQLWDIDDPALYTIRIRLIDTDGSNLDSADTRFGFRTFAFTGDDGFHLNGRRVQLKGVNLHHDLGPLGGAFNRRATQRQLEIMMEMGVNAVRAAHNPFAPEMLELCDEMGLLVWDEVFDKWAWTAGRDDFTPPLPGFAHRHIRNTILRGRNHPSVVVWSVGNEVNPGDESEGVTPERVAMMAGLARSFDSTRPITMACHIPSLVDGRNFETLDLTGWNYARRYARYRDVWPDRPIIYSESASTVSTRGFYDPELPPRPVDYGDGYRISSYDLNAAFWSDIPDKEFELMIEDDYVAGEFVWTGFDYLGEPTPHDADSRSSYFGIVDLCGFPKDRFYLYRSHWRDDVDTVHILPHWNWQGREGKNVPVFVYTNGDSAELFLNGESLGLRRKGERPDRAPNLAQSATATASSGSNADAALDDSLDSSWIAGREDANPHWTIDLGATTPIRLIQLDTNQKEHLFAYRMDASADGDSWQTLVEKPTTQLQPWQGTQRAIHPVEAQARYLRVAFTEVSDNARAGLKDFRVFSQHATNDYFDVTYDYRLRWDEVAYEPGELRAIAYRDGQAIGAAKVETTGKPVSLRLSADRSTVKADGQDLVFVTVEALDAEGRPCPLADNVVAVSVSGEGSLEATGNGDPRSFVSFASPQRELFYGKALLIVRPNKDEGGGIRIEASSEGLKTASIAVTAK